MAGRYAELWGQPSSAHQAACEPQDRPSNQIKSPPPPPLTPPPTTKVGGGGDFMRYMAHAAASPSSRERRPPAGPTPWRWTGRAGCGTTTPPASPHPTPTPRRPGGRWPPRCTPSSPGSPTFGGPLPEPGEVWATARWPDVLRRVDPSPHRDLPHEVAREAGRLADGWEHGRPPRLPAPPCRLPLAGRRLLPRPPPPMGGAPTLG